MIFVGYYLSSRPVVFCNKGVLRIFSKFTGKHQCWSVFLIKLQTCSSFKKRLQHRCFPVKFARFFRTPILYMITYAIQNSCTKTFTAKFMWTTASGISENRQIYWCFAEFYISQLHWWTRNQRINVDDATHIITELYIDVQTAVRGNFEPNQFD